MTTPAKAAELIRSRQYSVLPLIAAVIGAPISALAYLFLYVVGKLQRWLFQSLPHELGFHGEPLW